MKQFLKFALIALLLIPITLVTARAQDPPDSTAVALDSLKEVTVQVDAANDSIKKAEGPILYSSTETGTVQAPVPVNNITKVGIVLSIIVSLSQVIKSLVANIKFLNTTVPGILTGLGTLYLETEAMNGWQNLTWEHFIIAGLVGLLGVVQKDVDWKLVLNWLLALIKKKPATG